MSSVQQKQQPIESHGNEVMPNVLTALERHCSRGVDAIHLARIEYETLRAERDAATTPEDRGRLAAFMDLAMDRWGKALGARAALDALAAELADPDRQVTS